MKGIRKARKAITRTMSGDGLPITRSRSKSHSRRKGPLNTNDAQIFCNDMYTVDYVLESLADVSKNAEIDTIVLEDLIERNHAKLTQAVQEMLVQTTMSANISLEEGAAPEESKSRPFSRSTKQQQLPKRRIWKNIVVCDCISDSQSYQVYLSQKREFVSCLTRFLSLQGMTNDLPISFQAKLELHTLLEGATILDLLQALQRDTSVTRIEFGGALSHTERHVPEEFGKLIDIEEGCTVQESIEILLHYDKQSLNMDDNDNDDNPQSSTRRTGRTRRQSQLDVSVLNTIRRMALILENKLMPKDRSGFTDVSELSEGETKPEEETDIKPFKDVSEQSTSKRKKEKANAVKLDLFGNPIEGSSELLTDQSNMSSSQRRGREAMDGSGHGRRAAVRLTANGRKLAQSTTSAKRVPNRNKVKRVKSMDVRQSRGTKKGPKRVHSVDEVFWEKVKQFQEDGGRASPKRRSPSNSPPSSPKSKITSMPDSPPRNGRKPSPPTSPKSKREKQRLVKSVNSISAPPMGTLLDDAWGDQSGRSPGSRKKNRKKPIADGSTNLKANGYSDSENSHKSKKKNGMDDSSAREKEKQRKKRDEDVSEGHSERSSGSKKGRSKKNCVKRPPLRRSSSDVQKAGNNISKPDLVDRSKSDHSANSPRRGVRRSRSFDAKGNGFAADPDFDWNLFSASPKTKDPSGLKATKNGSLRNISVQ